MRLFIANSTLRNSSLSKGIASAMYMLFFHLAASLCFGGTTMNHWSFRSLHGIGWVFSFISIAAQFLPLSIPAGLPPSEGLIPSKLRFLYSNICLWFCSTVTQAWPKTVVTRIWMIQGNKFQKDSGDLSSVSQLSIHTPRWVVNGVLIFPGIL